FIHQAGHCYSVMLPPTVPLGDDENAPLRSAIKLVESGTPLGPPHSGNAEVVALGQGRYSHWMKTLVFSASDNSSPLTNGRRYQVVLPSRLSEHMSSAARQARTVVRASAHRAAGLVLPRAA